MNNQVARHLVAKGLQQIANQVRGNRAFILVQSGDDLFVSMLAEQGDRGAQLRLLENVTQAVTELAQQVWHSNDAPRPAA